MNETKGHGVDNGRAGAVAKSGAAAPLLGSGDPVGGGVADEYSGSKLEMGMVVATLLEPHLQRARFFKYSTS